MSQRGGWLLHGVLLDTRRAAAVRTRTGRAPRWEMVSKLLLLVACVLLRVVSRGLDPAFSAL